MEKENVNVRVLFVMKTKDNKKCMLKFALDSNDTSISRGFLIIDQWFQNSKPFDNLTSDYIDTILEGNICYKHTYGSNAVMQLVELLDENGTNLLA